MSNFITTAQETELADPTLRRIAKRVAKEMTLAIEKTIAHEADPQKYPLPADPDSVEKILWQRYQQLSKAQRERAVSRIMPRVQAGQKVRQRVYKDLANVDLESSTPIADQVDALPYPKDLKMSPDRLRKVSEVHGEILRAGNGLVPQQTTDKLELRIHKVHCIDETNGKFVEKVGNDEILLGGTAVDQSGKTHKIAPFLVGANFDDGESKKFKPPRRFTRFDLREGTDFPKSYFVTFLLFEKDGGGAAEFINKLLAKVKERVISAITAAVGGFVGASGGPVGVAIGAAIGFVVGKVFEASRPPSMTIRSLRKP